MKSLLPLLLASCCALTAAERGFGPDAAREDTKKLEAGDGLEATLFASEPMLVNPCDMDVDARGRVWITEGANYRKWSNPPLRPDGDRIVILEDTNGDGVADNSKTFYQDPSINSALGICVLGNKVIVSCSPHVFVLTDSDGDDKADKRELLFTGIKGVQHDHGVHAFVFGPDGKFYFNMGNDSRQIERPLSKECPLHGPVKVESKTVIDEAGNEVLANGKPYRQGMVFRCNLDGSEFETLGHNFRNNYEVCVDSFGTLWQSDNDDDGNRGVRINYVMEFGNFGYQDEMTGAGWSEAWKKANAKEKIPDDEKWRYHWHQDDPGVVPNLLNTGAGSPCGILVYEGKLLPKIFQNQIIHADAGPRVVRAYPVTPDGAGYKADMANILSSSDSWYRPSDVCIAPDGSLFIADWNDPGVGGHNMGDNKAESLRGRVYRVAPKGQKYSVPKTRALDNPNLAVRYEAWTDLHNRQGAAEAELKKLWADDSDPHIRARALQLLARIKGKEKTYIDAGLKDKDPDIRITAIRIGRSLKQDIIPIVKQLANDKSAQVRRECAIALRHNSSPEAPKLWAALAKQHDSKDRWYLEALGIGMDKQEEKFFGAWLVEVGDKWSTPAGRDIVWRSRTSKTPALLAKLVTDKNLPEKDKAHYLRALDFIKGPEKEAALVEIATSGL